MMSLEELRAGVLTGSVDTVIVAMTDMQGRLQGKRLHAQFFLDEVLAHGTEACSYLLAVDTEMNTVPGYALSSWEGGYGDFALVPDLGTLRMLPWQPGTALVLADVHSVTDGSPVSVSPRQVLSTALASARDLGWTAMAGTELEFIVFEDSYEKAWDAGYRGLVPANRYNVDYSVLGTSRVEPLLRDIRNSMAGAGLTVESAKGECNLGQHEIAFRYRDALTTADQHVIYKTGAKEIAARHGYSLTFMAKVNAAEGNSCHIHLSFAAGSSSVMAGDGPYGLSAAGASVLAGMQAGLRDMTLLLAPTVNSYKRYVPGSFAPTAVAWGPDNRTCALRLVGHGPSLRVECRVPGGDVNPYLALAALVVSALEGVRHELPLPDPVTGNAYSATDVLHVPTSLAEALSLWSSSELVASAFGKDVVDHYANMARVEIEAFGSAVTDWELRRYFERILCVSRAGPSSSPAPGAGSGWRRRGVSLPRGPTSWRSTSMTRPGRRQPRRQADCMCARTSHPPLTFQPPSRRRSSPTARWTWRSTTPASRRQKTTRSSTLTSTPGGGCRRSTSPRSTSAARRRLATCGARARARS
jgi:glutamine synthetase